MKSLLKSKMHLLLITKHKESRGMETGVICKDCIGVEKCNKYCTYNAGINLIEFINNVDTVESQIGELSIDKLTNKASFIVSGHMLKAGEPPTYMLSSLSIGIDASGKLTSYGNKTPFQILKSTLSILNTEEQRKADTLDTFKTFNSNRLLPIPIKPGSDCEIVFKNKDDKKVSSSGKVTHIQWTVGKKNGKIGCCVYVIPEKGANDNNSKGIKIPLSEYGVSITLPQIERTLKSAEIDRELIKMSDLGLIKPIVISDDKITIAADKNYVYRLTDTMPVIVAQWKDGKIVDKSGGLSTVSKSKAYKKFHNALNYIERHRRFIVPYGFYEPNKITV